MNLGDIRDLARAKADEQSDEFIGGTELDRYINQGLRFIYGQILQKFENHFIVRGTTGNGGLFTQASGTDEYALPATLQKLVLVQTRRTGTSSNDAWIRVDRKNIANNGIDVYSPLREDSLHRVGYYVTGTTLVFEPVPTESVETRLTFVPRVTALVAVTDVPGIPEEYHELISEYAAIQMLRKSGEGIFTESYKIFTDEVKNLLQTVVQRDLQPSMMTITDDGDNDTYYGW